MRTAHVSLAACLFLASSHLGCAKDRSSEPQAGTVAPPPAAQAAPERAAPQGATATPVKALDKKKFGAAITEKSTTSLMSLVNTPDKFASQTIRTEGTVTAVCKAMGCWMEIGDETGQAHIKMAGHGFFVPREASGHRAVVQGKVLGSDQNGQCGADGEGKDGCREEAEKQTGRVAKVEIEATGVEFVD